MTPARLLLAVGVGALLSRVAAGQPLPASSGAAATFEEVSRKAAAAREADLLDEAVELYRKGVSLRPSWDEGFWYLGTLLYELDRYEEARPAFQRFVVLKPEGGPAWAFLGLCEYRTGEYEAAFRHLTRGREAGLGEFGPMLAVVGYHMALLHIKRGEFELALRETFVLARQQEQANPQLLEAMGLATLRLPLLPQELAPEKKPLVESAGRATHHYAARRKPEALALLKELIDKHPATPNLHYAYGLLLLLDDHEAAMRAFRHELEISKDHVPARLQMAFEHLKAGDHISALPLAEEAVALEPDSFVGRGALGQALLAKGDAAAAVRELEAAVKLAPDSPEMHFQLARAYAKAGRKDDAERERRLFQELEQRRLRQAESGGSAPSPPEL